MEYEQDKQMLRLYEKPAVTKYHSPDLREPPATRETPNFSRALVLDEEMSEANEITGYPERLEGHLRKCISSDFSV